MTKKSILTNWGFVLLDKSENKFFLLKDEEEVQRFKNDGQVADDDLVIQLTADTVRVAEKIEYIDLK